MQLKLEEDSAIDATTAIAVVGMPLNSNRRSARRQWRCSAGQQQRLGQGLHDVRACIGHMGQSRHRGRRQCGRSVSAQRAVHAAAQGACVPLALHHHLHGAHAGAHHLHGFGLQRGRQNRNAHKKHVPSQHPLGAASVRGGQSKHDTDAVHR